MSSCGFGVSADSGLLNPDQPWGHIYAKGIISSLNIDNPKTFGPAGTVHCSMADWLKYVQVHIKGFNKQDTKILLAKNFIKLHSDYLGQGYSSGGWGVAKRKWAKGTVLTHAGSNSLNLAKVFVAPNIKSGFIAVTNYAFSDAPEKATEELLQEMIFK